MLAVLYVNCHVCRPKLLVLRPALCCLLVSYTTSAARRLLRSAGERGGNVEEGNFPIKLRPPLRRRASAAFRP